MHPDMLMQVVGEVNSQQLGQGFRTPGLIRFVSQDTGYLSPTSDGPRMFVNLEDYLSHTTGHPNTQFQVNIELHQLMLGAACLMHQMLHITLHAATST